jgi:large subunit ribosomal protein L6
MKPGEIRKEIEIPDGVQIEVTDSTVRVRYGDREESKRFKVSGITLSVEDNKLVIVGKPAKKKVLATVNTLVSHVKNLITGVTKGFEYKLKVVYSHFPITVQKKDDGIVITNFMGEKRPRIAKIVGNNTIVEIKGKDITVRGTNIEHVGQTAANIERATIVRRKDRRVFQDGIYIVSRSVCEGDANA